MYQGQAHVREAMVNVDPLVDKYNADGGQQVHQKAKGDPPVMGHRHDGWDGDGQWPAAAHW